LRLLNSEIFGKKKELNSTFCILVYIYKFTLKLITILVRSCFKESDEQFI